MYQSIAKGEARDDSAFAFVARVDKADRETVFENEMHLHRRGDDGTTAKAKDHPLYRVLHKRPNGYQTALEFKAHMQLCALLDGNAYARVVWGVKGGKPAVIALMPFQRRTITPSLNAAGGVDFRYQPSSGAPQTLDAVCGHARDGAVGRTDRVLRRADLDDAADPGVLDAGRLACGGARLVRREG